MDAIRLLVLFLLRCLPRRLLNTTNRIPEFENTLVAGVHFRRGQDLYSLAGSDNLIHLNKEFETEIAHWFDLPEQGVFVDVGSNIGKYAVKLAKKASLVIAFEPNPRTFRRLAETLSLNKIPNVVPIQAALWDMKGTAKLFEKIHHGGDSLVMNDDSTGTITVRTLTFDGIPFGLDRLDLVKVDAEGAECQIIRGMLRSLNQFRPRVIVEIKPQDLEEMYEMMRNAGYWPASVSTEDHLFVPIEDQQTTVGNELRVGPSVLCLLQR